MKTFDELYDELNFEELNKKTTEEFRKNISPTEGKTKGETGKSKRKKGITNHKGRSVCYGLILYKPETKGFKNCCFYLSAFSLPLPTIM